MVCAPNVVHDVQRWVHVIRGNALFVISDHKQFVSWPYFPARRKMAVPPHINVTVVGLYTITCTIESLDGKPVVRMTTSPMPQNKEEAMQLCAQIIVQRDSVIAHKDQIIIRLTQEYFLLRGEKEQLLKEKNELHQKLTTLQAALENLKQ